MLLPSLLANVRPGPITLGVLCGVTAGITVAALVASQATPEIEVRTEIRTRVEVQTVALPGPIVERVIETRTSPDPRASEIHLVAPIAHVAYMHLADIGDEAEILPRHGTARLVDPDDTGVTAVIAPVADRDVPQAYRAWRSRAVQVDASCTANISGFALVWRLVGTPGYAGSDAETWTAASVVEHGSAFLAATLDGCGKTATSRSFARDAALSKVVVPVAIDDAKLAARAQALLMASPLIAKTDENIEKQWGGPTEWKKDLHVESAVLRHPTTNQTFVSVHLSSGFACGLPQASLWGLYRVAGDALEPVQVRDLGSIQSIARLVDIEGDGDLEIIGSPWLPLDTVVTRADGTTLEDLALPFFGCPC